MLMFFTIRPLLEHLPGNSSFVRCIGLRYGLKPQINGFGDAQAEVFEGESHGLGLSVPALIQIPKAKKIFGQGHAATDSASDFFFAARASRAAFE